MRNDNTLFYILLGTAIVFLGGCATFRRTRHESAAPRESQMYRLIPLRDAENPEVVHFYIPVKEETYFDIVNEQAREKADKNRVRNTFKQKRHIGFFGMLKETAKEVGVKVVFPW